MCDQLSDTLSHLLSPLLCADEMKLINSLPRTPSDLNNINSNDSPIINDIASARSEVLRLYNKQEYYRRAYNKTLKRLEFLAQIIPRYALDSILFPTQANEPIECENNSSTDVDIDPGLLDFMIETMKHRELRDRAKSAKFRSALYCPPPSKNKSDYSKLSVNKIETLEAALLHYYEYSSPCKDSPFWPVLPLRSS